MHISFHKQFGTCFFHVRNVYSNGNINSGQSKAKQKSFAVQTPAVDFSILNDTVSVSIH